MNDYYNYYFTLNISNQKKILSPLVIKMWAGQRSRYSDWLRAGRSGGSNPGGGRDFPQLFRPALRTTQPPVQLVPGLSRGKQRPGRDADPSPPSSAVVMEGQSYTSTPPMGRTGCTEPQCLYRGALLVAKISHDCLPYNKKVFLLLLSYDMW